MKNTILDEQIEYYRARAQEYDGSIAAASEMMRLGKSLLRNLGHFDSILELACGTGIWTETLLQMGNNVTAMDAAPEMLDIARQKLSDERISFQQADLFHWEPVQKYDLIFFANWLSHVPPAALDEFLNKVRRSIQPGGHLAMIDQYLPSDSDKQVARDDIYATRPLEDGRRFTIVKAFYDLPQLQDKLEGLGLEVSVDPFTDTFFFLVGKAKNP